MPTPYKDYYQLLGISRDASDAEVRSAYRKLALKYYPDRNPDDPGAEEKFKQINAAYLVLSDPVKRATYLGAAPQTTTTEAERQPGKVQLLLAGLAALAIFLVLALGSLVLRSSLSPTRSYPAQLDFTPTLIPASTLTRASTPVLDPSIPALPITIIPLAAGNEYTCALTRTGGVKCWGDNTRGQLGDGTNTNSLTPVDVSGLNAGVVAITAGGYHTCALLESGGVKCWGSGLSGELGNGETLNNDKKSVPVDVIGLSSGVVAISAGFTYTCALTDRGAVKCWGSDLFTRGSGVYGSGGFPYITPVDVDGLNVGAVALAVGSTHACALTNAGGVKCWTAANSSKYPFANDVDGLSSGVAAITARNAHTCALTDSGGVKCWGANNGGQLGNGTFAVNDEIIFIPVDVNGLSSGVKAILAGPNSTCASMNTHALKCWGWNPNGELGDGTLQDSAIPVDVTILNDNVKFMARGGEHICVLTDNDQVKCWGKNDFGQLGNGTTKDSITPVSVAGLSVVVLTPDSTPIINATPTPVLDASIPALPVSIISLAAGNEYTCALTGSGGVKCWGDNTRGQLGDGTRTNSLLPVDVSGLNTGVVAITANGYHTCALLKAGGVKCWGGGSSGELGNRTTAYNIRPVPVDVVGLSSGIIAISAGLGYTCALTDRGAVKCWGQAEYQGRANQRSDPSSYMPVDVDGLNNSVVAITTGDDHACALTDVGVVKCWGKNNPRQLGRRVTSGLSAAVGDVDGLSRDVAAIAAGRSHTCVLTNVGGVKCWGENGQGQLGNGMFGVNWEQVSTLGDVNGLSSGVEAIVAGASSTCALMNTSVPKCWGWNRYDQISYGTMNGYTAIPVDIAVLSESVKAIALGGAHTCVLTDADQVKCWGANNSGQLGNGTTIYSRVPVGVLGLNGAVVTPYSSSVITPTPTPRSGYNPSKIIRGVFPYLNSGESLVSPKALFL